MAKNKTTFAKVKAITYTNGTTVWQVRFQVTDPTGKKVRKAQIFHTKTEAAAYAAHVRLKRENEGTAVLSLPAALTAERVTGADILRLRALADQRSHYGVVRLCERAIAGSTSAWRECEARVRRLMAQGAWRMP